MKRKAKILFSVALIMFLPLLCTAPKAKAYEGDKNIIVYVYPVELKKGDVISDGKDGTQYKIRSDTLFIWVDLLPGAFFTHPTKYIFIRDNQNKPVKIYDGQWWPYLNGQQILYGSPNKTALTSPCQLGEILVYFYPLELKYGDVVADGHSGTEAFLYNIEGDTLLIWIDLMPALFFTHPTCYVFICGNSEEPVVVKKGGWWPYLNGQGILHVNKNLGALISPFKLSLSAENPDKR